VWRIAREAGDHCKSIKPGGSNPRIQDRHWPIAMQMNVNGDDRSETLKALILKTDLESRLKDLRK